MPQGHSPVKELAFEFGGGTPNVLTLLAVTSGFCISRPAGIFKYGFGAVAQLGERCVRNAEVEGSTPFRSTFFGQVLGPVGTCRTRVSTALGRRMAARK
jgi:hypothetical protein